jgi:hypothetical protein
MEQSYSHLFRYTAGRKNKPLTKGGRERGVGGVAQAVERSSSKHETLNLNRPPPKFIEIWGSLDIIVVWPILTDTHPFPYSTAEVNCG